MGPRAGPSHPGVSGPPTRPNRRAMAGISWGASRGWLVVGGAVPTGTQLRWQAWSEVRAWRVHDAHRSCNCSHSAAIVARMQHFHPRRHSFAFDLVLRTARRESPSVIGARRARESRSAGEIYWPEVTLSTHHRQLARAGQVGMVSRREWLVAAPGSPHAHRGSCRRTTKQRGLMGGGLMRHWPTLAIRCYVAESLQGGRPGPELRW